MTAYQASPIRRTRATRAEAEARREALLDIIEAEESERDMITRLVGKIARKRLR